MYEYTSPILSKITYAWSLVDINLTLTFVTSEQPGIGATQQSLEIVTKLSFFLKINLPYSLKQNELAIIPVTLHSYEKECLNVGKGQEWVGVRSGCVAGRGGGGGVAGREPNYKWAQ